MEYEVHMKRYLSERNTKFRQNDAYWNGIRSSREAVSTGMDYGVHMKRYRLEWITEFTRSDTEWNRLQTAHSSTDWNGI